MRRTPPHLPCNEKKTKNTTHHKSKSRTVNMSTLPLNMKIGMYISIQPLCYKHTCSERIYNTTNEDASHHEDQGVLQTSQG